MPRASTMERWHLPSSSLPGARAVRGPPSRLSLVLRPLVVVFIVVLSSPLRGHDALETTVERGFFERERKKRSVVRAGAAVETGPVVARSSADSSRCTVPTPLAL